MTVTFHHRTGSDIITYFKFLTFILMGVLVRFALYSSCWRGLEHILLNIIATGSAPWLLRLLLHIIMIRLLLFVFVVILQMIVGVGRFLMPCLQCTYMLKQISLKGTIRQLPYFKLKVHCVCVSCHIVCNRVVQRIIMHLTFSATLSHIPSRNNQTINNPVSMKYLKCFFQTKIQLHCRKTVCLNFAN